MRSRDHAEREAGVEDVIEQEHVLIAQIDAGGPVHFHFAGGGGAALVAAGAERVHAHGHFELPQQIGDEEQRAVHQRHNGDDFACQLHIQPRGHLSHTGADLRRREQDAFEIVDDAGDGG
jgi:hypothetical protein